MNLWLTALAVFVLNIPFGYWRGNEKKFSLRWALAIHLPVPFVIALRFIAHLGFRFVTYPVLVGAFFGGQYTGGMIYKFRKNNQYQPLTSCLVWDCVSELRDRGK